MLDRLPLSAKQLRSVAHATARINVWSGAVRSGKTIASLLAFLMAVVTAPSSGLIIMVGKSLQTIERNALEPLMDEALFGPIARQVKHTTGSTTAVILGRVVHLIGANDSRSEGRLRGLTASLAYVDEATLLPEGFWNQLLGRLSVPGARLFATTNPDGPGHWLKKRFLDRKAELDLRSWHFTLDDNPSLDPAYVASLKAEYVGLWYQRFILGRWVQAEGAIYDCFDPDRMVVDLIPQISRWLAVGIDYGTVNAFSALLLGQGVDGRLYVTSEYRHDSRLARRQLTDLQYSRNVRDWLEAQQARPEWVFVDPSAASFSTQLWADGVPGVAPAVNDVLDGIRSVSVALASGLVSVHRSCTGLLDELPGYAWDDAAAERGEDKPLKINDHSCFVAGTAVLTETGERPIETVQPGDRVLTREGWKCVTTSGLTNSQAQVYSVELSNGRTLTGTGNHPVWVTGQGWTRLDALRPGLALSTPSSSAASSSAATPTPQATATAGTTSPASPTASAASGDFTKRSGRQPTAATYRLATTSTTSTTIPSTTSPATSSAFPQTSTELITPRTSSSSGLQSGSPTSNASALSPLPGTAATQDGPGTPSMVSVPGLAGRSSSGRVSGAGPRTALAPELATSGSAPTPARPRGAAMPASMTRPEPASTARRSTASTGSAGPGSAGVVVLRVTTGAELRPVWNLSVADCPEYFAEGVLVHNCDALRYALHSTAHTWRGLIPNETEAAA